MTLQELFDKPEKWTQHAWARNKAGKVVLCDETGITNSSAVCWCLSAGICKCYPKEATRIRALIMEEIDRPQVAIHGESWRSPVIWNDHAQRTYKDVKDLITRLDI